MALRKMLHVKTFFLLGATYCLSSAEGYVLSLAPGSKRTIIPSSANLPAPTPPFQRFLTTLPRKNTSVLTTRLLGAESFKSDGSHDNNVAANSDVDGHNVAAVAIAEGAVEDFVPPQLKGRFAVARHTIPISIALIIGTFSVLEIAESIKELNERVAVGHAHGITVLAFLRLGRAMAFFKLLRHKKHAIRTTRRLVRFKSKALVKVAKGAAVLQTQTEELEERAGELKHVLGGGGQHSRQTDHHDEHNAGSAGTGRAVNTNKDEIQAKAPRKTKTIRSVLVSFLTSTQVAISAAVVAVLACLVEIMDDMKPGAHHGAALLALSEVHYQIRRLKARVVVDVETKQRKATSSSWRNMIPIGPLIAIAAAIYAGIEIRHDLKPGAHHGVAILAMAELVENVNRSRILHQLSADKIKLEKKDAVGQSAAAFGTS